MAKEGLSESITHKLIPWVELGRANILVMPCSTSDLPGGVKIRKKPIQGTSRRLKYHRSGGQISVNTALWPEDGLCAKSSPFLVWVLSGRAEMQIGAQVLTCEPTTAVLIPAGLPHPDGSRPHTPRGGKGSCSILWMRQCGRGFRIWISHSQDGQNLRSIPGQSVYFPQEKIIHVFNVLCEELQNHAQGKAAEHALVLFLLLIQQELAAERAFNVAVHRAVGEVGEWNSTQQHPIDQACSYIQSHLSAPLTLEGVARIVHMSRATFARQFREYSGSTFLEYVQKHRIEQAQAFLNETDWTVRTISKLCGFASDSAFSTFFSKATGITPIQYRRESRHEFKNNETKGK